MSENLQNRLIYCIARLAKAMLLSNFVVGASLSFAEINDRNVLELVPVREVNIADGQINLSYILPCASKSVGVYIDHRSDDKDLRVAIVANHQNTVCAGMPTLQTQKLEGINFKNIKRIVKIAPRNFPKRLISLNVDELVYSNNGGNKTITALLPIRCGEVYGSIIADRGGVGFVGEDVKKEKQSSCVFRYQTVELSYLNAANLKFRPLSERKDPTKVFDLKIRRIISMKHPNSNSAAFTFERSCNEAPVALLLENSNEKTSAPRLGILTTRFINTKCSQKKIRDTFTLNGYRIAGTEALRTFKTSSGFAKFHLRAPKAALLNQSKLEVSYVQTCKAPLALAIYPTQQNSAVAILEQNSASRCQNAPKETIVSAAFATVDTTPRTVYPLQLTGSGYF